MQLCIVTPTWNSARFLERTIESVISCAGFDDIEYYIIDGGSTDGTVDIIKKYEKYLTGWVSEPDEGMYHAIEKGFAKSRAGLMGWLNSDDVFMPSTLKTVKEIFEAFHDVSWITSRTPIILDGDGNWTRADLFPGVDKEGFYEGETLPTIALPATGFISQESTFWRKSLWRKAGAGFNHEFKLACDFDLWARFFEHEQLWTVNIPLAGFGSHGDNMSQQQADIYANECVSVLERYGRLQNMDLEQARFRVASRYFRDCNLNWLTLPNTPTRPVYRIFYDEGEKKYQREV